ncbi:hypothetical protein HIM_01108 [Hirsutella minnesotensis 3608]|nr:hypothetical protein HIM_01108 [Hirsutella minnesotensis 3608]
MQATRTCRASLSRHFLTGRLHATGNLPLNISSWPRHAQFARQQIDHSYHATSQQAESQQARASGAFSGVGKEGRPLSRFTGLPLDGVQEEGTVRSNDSLTVPVAPTEIDSGSLQIDAESGDLPPRARRKPRRRTRSLAKGILQNFQKASWRENHRLSPKGWESRKVSQSLYRQWGFIRHQYPESEVVQARRDFKSWKIKLDHVKSPSCPSSWPWLEDGRWLFELDSVTAMRRAWQSRELDLRRREWPLVLLSTMHLCPDKAHMVLEATLDPLPPGYAIHDILLFLAQRFSLDNSLTLQERHRKADGIFNLIGKICGDMPDRHVPFGQRIFGLLARKLPVKHTQDLLAILGGASTKPHANTLLHFASTLAKDESHKSTAFAIIKSLINDGLNINDPKVASVLTTLFHHQRTSDEQEPIEGAFSPKEALSVLIEKGFSPNVITATAFLDSLCQSGEVEEATRLALFFAERGIRLDARAWQTVFRGAKASLQAANVEKALEVAKAASAPYVAVLNNSLHSIYYFANAESRERPRLPPWVAPIFIPMLGVYVKRFDLEALQWWFPELLPILLTQKSPYREMQNLQGQPSEWMFPRSILPVVDRFFSSGTRAHLQPSNTTIAIMIRAYIKSLHHPRQLMAFYDFFKSRLENTDETNPARGLIRDQGSLIHDAFIIAMTEHRILVRQALQVFGDMLKTNSLPKTQNQERQVQDMPSWPAHPRPSVVTFTVLLRGLLNCGEHVLADQILQVMEEAGIKPTVQTWNTLIKGYASLQNVKQTVNTLQALEAAGFRPDSFTYKAFGKLHDQSRALDMMEKIIDENRRIMEERGGL